MTAVELVAVKYRASPVCDVPAYVPINEYALGFVEIVQVELPQRFPPELLTVAPFVGKLAPKAVKFWPATCVTPPPVT
jgi:hypothetical protein